MFNQTDFFSYHILLFLDIKEYLTKFFRLAYLRKDSDQSFGCNWSTK